MVIHDPLSDPFKSVWSTTPDIRAEFPDASEYAAHIRGLYTRPSGESDHINTTPWEHYTTYTRPPVLTTRR